MDVDHPPVEAVLEALVGDSHVKVHVHAASARSATPVDDVKAEHDGLRHNLVDAVGPLREAINFAVATGSGIPNGDKLWAHLRRRVAADTRVPAWILALLDECEEEILSRVETKSTMLEALPELHRRLTQIEGFIVALERTGFSWRSIEEPVPESEELCRVLWVDDEPTWHDALSPAFAKFRIATTFHASVKSLPAPDALGDFDAIVVDLVLDGQGNDVKGLLASQGIAPYEEITDQNAGLGVLQVVQALPLPPPTFVLSARESPSAVRACTILGAQDYFVKGRGAYLHLLVALRRALQGARDRLVAALRPANPRLVVGSRDDPVSRTLLWIDRIASSGTRGPVMLLGEPGVGKEEFAREVHLRSSRRTRPFVVIDCTALVPTLIESELFGHKKGAFNGAIAEKPGLFELANGGVAFIDEIDKLEVSLQQRLLRVSAVGETRRVGDTQDRRVDVLLVLASNVDPSSEEGRDVFSEPLVTRIEKYVLRLPPLSRRLMSIRALANALCARVCAELGWEPRILLPDAVEWLERQAAAGRFDGGGGNVRGLYNLIERALVFSPSGEALGARAMKLACGPEPLLAGTDSREPLREPARLTADAILESGQAVLKAVKDEFEAELLRELVGRLGRQETATFLGTSDANVRHYIMKLRKKGLWKWDL